MTEVPKRQVINIIVCSLKLEDGKSIVGIEKDIPKHMTNRGII